MKKNIARKGITLTLAAVMAMAVMTGCGDKAADAVAISESATPTTDSVDAGYVQALKADSQAVYFTKGVYASYEPKDAEAENFSAANYVFSSHGEDLLYTSANGWSVRYNPSCIAVNEGGPLTTFVYTGDCAGTCMITVTYDVGKDAKAAADELAKSWGDEAKATECIFPATEDVPGFYVDAHPGQMGPGFYESAFLRDYMDGYLVFEFTDHMCGDDAIDIPVSDALSGIIDSLKFD